MDFDSALIIAMLFGAVFSGKIALRNQKWRWPFLTSCLCVLLALCFLLQVSVPHSLSLFERNTGEVVAGQWWRLFSALFLQDGWLFGTAFNIVMLVFVGGVAEQLLSRIQWAAIYFTGGILSEIIGLSWQPVGAGNSIATCALAGCVVAIMPIPIARPLATGVRLAALAAAIGLCVRQDIHGASFLIGALLGISILRAGTGEPPQSRLLRRPRASK